MREQVLKVPENPQQISIPDSQAGRKWPGWKKTI
jgi:hypothetical protein